MTHSLVLISTTPGETPLFDVLATELSQETVESVRARLVAELKAFEIPPVNQQRLGRPRDYWAVTMPPTVEVLEQHGLKGFVKLGDGWHGLERAGRALRYRPGSLTAILAKQVAAGGSKNQLDVRGVTLTRNPG